MVLLLPICILKEVSKMSIFSTFGIGTLFVLVFIIIGECPFFIKHYFEKEYKKEDKSTHLNIYDISKGFNSDMDFLKAVATLFYAYTCQAGAMPIINSLKVQTKQNVDKIFKTSIAIDVVVYLIIGITGYLTQPIDTPDLIIERKNIFSSDWVMVIGRIAFIITLCPKICNNYNALRCSMLTLLGYDTKNYPNSINWILTLIFLIISTCIASLYQSISDYISLIGSFCSVVIAMLIPALCYIKGNEYEISNCRNIVTIILAVILCLFGLTSGGFTIKGIIEQLK
ncbi:MAG: amino acid transporter [archaeon]|nr:amino acid transporter [archaeon]